MSSFGSLGGQNASRLPTPPRGESIGRYDTYLEAQRAVDFLSDAHFPVQFVTIVGSGLRMVERVTGRLTYPRVAGAGAASGAWFGLFVGLLLSLFGGGAELGLIAAVVFGAGFGMFFGVISYAFTRGRRDFTSTSQIVAGEYEILCLPEQAQAARALLDRLPGGAGRQTPTGAVSAAQGHAQGAARSAAQEPAPRTGAPGISAPSDADAQGEALPAGPTYGEMMEKKRREQADRERAEREQTAQVRTQQETSRPPVPPA
jgi:hypothetical protein